MFVVVRLGGFLGYVAVGWCGDVGVLMMVVVEVMVVV